jgi:hypothetical protein
MCGLLHSGQDLQQLKGDFLDILSPLNRGLVEQILEPFGQFHMMATGAVGWEFLCM